MKIEKFLKLAAALSLVSLWGCASHLFLESETRLQLGNSTEDCSLISLDVASLDSSEYVPWIRETVLPGGRSHVKTEDWVGDFNVRIRYTKSKDASGDTLEVFTNLEFEGGSQFLKVGGNADTLTFQFK